MSLFDKLTLTAFYLNYKLWITTCLPFINCKTNLSLQYQAINLQIGI
jgi:hypothetical protein